MADTYGEVFSEMVDEQAKYDDRATVFRKLDISRNQFYNVTNPNRQTSAGNSYPFPTEWGVRATREFKDYSWIKMVNKDCDCLCITPEEIEALKSGKDHEETLALLQAIVSKVNKA